MDFSRLKQVHSKPAPSKKHGVGLFATHNIKRGTNVLPFYKVTGKWHTVKETKKHGVSHSIISTMQQYFADRRTYYIDNSVSIDITKTES